MLVERLERREVRKRAGHGICARRGGDKVEAREVINAERLELQEVRRNIAAHQFRHRPFGQRLKLCFRKEAQALARRSAPGAARALRECGLRCGNDGQDIHARRNIQLLFLCKACVNHIDNAVDRDTRLGDVRRDNHLARPPRCRQKDGALLARRQAGVQRQEQHRQRARRERRVPVLERLQRRLDLVAAGEKDEDIADRLRHMNAPGGLDRGCDIVRHRRRRVGDFDRKRASFEREDRDVFRRLARVRRVKVARKGLGVHRRARHNDAQLGAHAPDLFEERDE